VILPLLRPAIGTVLLLTTVATWNDFVLQTYWPGGLLLGASGDADYPGRHFPDSRVDCIDAVTIQ